MSLDFEGHTDGITSAASDIERAKQVIEEYRTGALQDLMNEVRTENEGDVAEVFANLYEEIDKGLQEDEMQIGENIRVARFAASTMDETSIDTQRKIGQI